MFSLGLRKLYAPLSATSACFFYFQSGLTDKFLFITSNQPFAPVLPPSSHSQSIQAPVQWRTGYTNLSLKNLISLILVFLHQTQHHLLVEFSAYSFGHFI